MSNNSQNHGSGSEQDVERSPSPTMKRIFEFIDRTGADRSSATPLPTQAAMPIPSPIPVGSTQRSSPFIWPQPRGTPPAASETVDAGTRRIPPALRNASVATQSSTESAATPTPMIDQRVDGGYFGPEAGRPKSRKMKWTAENDRSLLLFGFGRDISGIECQAIADWFKEKPTAKAVQERLTKLRAAGRKVLKESGIFDADAPRNTPTTSRAPSVMQTVAPSQRLTTPATPATPATGTPTLMIPAPGPSPLGGQSISQLSPRRFLPATGSPALPGTLIPTTGAQDQQLSRTAGLSSYLPPFPATGMADDMGMEGMRGDMLAGAQGMPVTYSSAGRGVGRGSRTPFPRMLTTQEQDERLVRLYRQQSQQSASSTTGVASANVSGTAGENTDHDGGEGVDELRRSEMETEARRARWAARRDEEM